MIKRYDYMEEYGDGYIGESEDGYYVRHDAYASEVAQLTSIISGLQSTLEYVRAQTLQALDISWAGPVEESAEAVSKQYLDGLEDIKAVLSNV